MLHSVCRSELGSWSLKLGAKGLAGREQRRKRHCGVYRSVCRKSFIRQTLISSLKENHPTDVKMRDSHDVWGFDQTGAGNSRIAAQTQRNGWLQEL